jgi:hypothetical protein
MMIPFLFHPKKNQGLKLRVSEKPSQSEFGRRAFSRRACRRGLDRRSGFGIRLRFGIRLGFGIRFGIRLSIGFTIYYCEYK